MAGTSNVITNTNEDAYEEVTVELEPAEELNRVHSENMLIGKIVADRVLNRGAVKTILAKAWGNPDGLKIADLGVNKYAFVFRKREEMQEILKQGPWFILNRMINLQEWKQDVVMDEVDFSRMPFWIQLHGLPLGAMSEENAIKIASQIGETTEVEEWRVEGCALRGFIRVRVVVNILKPLLTGCWVPRANKPRVWVVFKYEKLQGFCYKCGIIGHEQTNYKHSKVMSVLYKDIPRYEQKLGVSAAKPFAVLVSEFERWRKNEQLFSKAQTNTSEGSSVGPRNENQEEVHRNQGREIVEVEDDGTNQEMTGEKGGVTSKGAQQARGDREEVRAEKKGVHRT